MLKITFDKKLNLLDQETIDNGPQNNGKLTSRATFVQETLYQTKAYSEDFDIFQRAGLRYSGQQYGKVNNSNLSITPKQEFLENIGNNCNVLNFVRDAFTAFDLNLQLLKQRGSIPKSSPIYNLEPQEFKNNITDLYFSFYETEYQLFQQFVNQNKYDKNIKDFNSFLNVFIKFVDIRTPLVPLTKSSFLSSRYVPKQINGLIIDLSNDDPNDDSIKYDKYIQNSAFKCYLDIVEESGFVINQDQPWQLIANLNSTKMKYYFMLRMKRLKDNNIISKSPIECNSTIYEECKEELENFNLENFLFNKNEYFDLYQVVNYTELKDLKRIIGRFYNSYISLKPNLLTLESKKENNSYYFDKKIISRKEINVLDLVEQDENAKWLRVYAYIKCRENNMSFDQVKFNSIVEKMFRIFSHLDISQAMVYLQSEISKTSDRRRKNRNFRF